jgi:hypothetical protein
VAGVYKKKDLKSRINISPVAGGVVMEGLLILAYSHFGAGITLDVEKLLLKPGAKE